MVQLCFAFGKDAPTVDALLKSRELVNATYKMLARICHPDSIGSDDQFKILNELNSVLES